MLVVAGGAELVTGEGEAGVAPAVPVEDDTAVDDGDVAENGAVVEVVSSSLTNSEGRGCARREPVPYARGEDA